MLFLPPNQQRQSTEGKWSRTKYAATTSHLVSFERVENKVTVNWEPSSLPSLVVDGHAEVAADYRRITCFHLAIHVQHTAEYHTNFTSPTKWTPLEELSHETKALSHETEARPSSWDEKRIQMCLVL